LGGDCRRTRVFERAWIVSDALERGQRARFAIGGGGDGEGGRGANVGVAVGTMAARRDGGELL
jgi:hypothetical protein